MRVQIPKITKKRALIITAATLSAFIVFTGAVWVMNNSYVQASKNDLKVAKANVKSSTETVTVVLKKFDPAKPEDQKKAIAALERYKKSLKNQTQPVANKIRPFLITSKEFVQAETELGSYETAINTTVKAVDGLIVTATYQVRLSDVFAPVFGNTASANAVDPAKQAAAWQQALDDIKKLTPDSSAKLQHTTLQSAMQEIISATNEVAAAQSKKDPDAYNAAMDKLNKSYESVNTAAEALQAQLKDKQTKLAQTAKSLF